MCARKRQRVAWPSASRSLSLRIEWSSGAGGYLAVRVERQNWEVTSPATYAARAASVSELERLSDKARELRLGQAGNPRLWEDANRAIFHVGYAVSAERMAGTPAEPGDATIWTIAGGLDVLLTVWWVRLKPGSVSRAPVFPILITMQPDDYSALDQAVIDEQCSTRRTRSLLDF